jgi:rubredoxin
MSYPWIIAHTPTQGANALAMECRRCGYVQKFSLPIHVSVWCAAAKAFEKLHKDCQERKDSQ